ncbi:MAG: putative integral membrane protein (TIGR02206 family) [Verrucomicrobiales bacterium]|jgi:hypothetical integral membrane protein (TIGR02206 family)
MNFVLAEMGDGWGLIDGFKLFGPAHIGVFVFVCVALAGMSWLARHPARAGVTLRFELVLAVIVLWSYPAKILTRYYGDVVMTAPFLPMHFCDWAGLAAFFALVLHNERMIEVTYFWGMAGTLQGLVTPNIEVGFPHPAWFAFFQLHAGVVLVGLYFVIGKRWRPKKGAVLRVFILANLYLFVAAIVDLMSVENNYGFLRSKPENGSLMDALGPWPFYIFAMQGLALVVFILFDLPFWRGRKKHASVAVPPASS